MKYNLPNPLVSQSPVKVSKYSRVATSCMQFKKMPCYRASILLFFLLLAAKSANSNPVNYDNQENLLEIEERSVASPKNIHLNNTSFKPDHNVAEAIGQFSTENENDTEHTYELVIEKANDGDKFYIVGDQLFLKSNDGLSGQSTFKIKVKSTDQSNEEYTKEFRLTKSAYKPEVAIKVVNAFSPNNDGINDSWIVPELRYYDMVQIEVFDRAGNRLFFTKDPEKGWDGRNKSGLVVPGAYFYMIRIDDILAVQRGVITVHKK